MEKPLQFFHDFKQGKECGLRYFMAEYGKPLRFFAYSFVQDKEVAEEIVSDSFFKLWQRKDSFQSLESVKAFLYIVTKNACYDYIGSPKNNVNTDDSALKFAISQDTDVLTKIINAELVSLIVKELQKLPEQQASIFRLSYLEGLNTTEICERLTTSSSNVYFAKSKVKASLKKAFEHTDYKWYILIFGCVIIKSVIEYL